MSNYNSKKTIEKRNEAWLKRDQSKRSKKKEYHPWQVFRSQPGEFLDKVVREVLHDLEKNKYQ